MSRITTTHQETNGCLGRRARGIPARLVFALLVVTSSLRAELSIFVRGDTNADSSVDIADPIKALEYLFLGGTIDCEDAADANDDGAVDIADPIFALGFLFLGGPALPAPGVGLCGIDPSGDNLSPCTARSCPGNEFFLELEPGKLRPPEDSSGEQAAAFQSGRLEEALDRVLNSPGDALDLDIEAGLSIGIYALVNANTKVTFKLAITVAEDSAHEVSIDYSLAGGLGVELYEGVEANARSGVGTTIVLRFADIAETVRAVHDVALSLIVEPARAGIEGLFGRAAEAAGRLDDALADFNGALADESALASKLDTVNSSLRTVNRRISDAGDELNGVLDELGRIACEIFQNRCDELQAAKNRLNRELDELQARRRALINEITDTEAQLALTRTAVARLRDGVQAAEAALGEAEQIVAEARQLIEALIGAQDRIGLSLAGYGFRYLNTADFQAVFSPFPGVKFGAGTFGVGAEAELTVSGRLDFSTASRPERFVLARTFKQTISTQAGSYVGKSFVEVTTENAFDKEGGVFNDVDSRFKVALDAYGEVVLGLGVVVRNGIGSHVEIDFALGQVAEHLPEIVTGLLDRDGSTLADTLLGVSATITRVERRTVGAGIDIGVSYAGYGGSFKGMGNWTDVGEATSTTIDAGSVVGAIVNGGEELLGAIGDRLDSEHPSN